MYPKDLDIPIPDINVLNERINSPEYQVQARIIIAWNLLILAMRINQKVLKNVNFFVVFFIKTILCVSFICKFVERIC